MTHAEFEKAYAELSDASARLSAEIGRLRDESDAAKGKQKVLMNQMRELITTFQASLPKQA